MMHFGNGHKPNWKLAVLALRWSIGVGVDCVWWCKCGLWWPRRWLRRPKSEVQILPRWGQADPAARVAWAAACSRARRLLAALKLLRN